MSVFSEFNPDYLRFRCRLWVFCEPWKLHKNLCREKEDNAGGERERDKTRAGRLKRGQVHLSRVMTKQGMGPTCILLTPRKTDFETQFWNMDWFESCDGSHQGAFLLLCPGPLAMRGDIFHSHYWGGALSGQAREGVRRPKVHRKPHTKELSTFKYQEGQDCEILDPRPIFGESRKVFFGDLQT